MKKGSQNWMLGGDRWIDGYVGGVKFSGLEGTDSRFFYLVQIIPQFYQNSGASGWDQDEIFWNILRDIGCSSISYLGVPYILPENWNTQPRRKNLCFEGGNTFVGQSMQTRLSSLWTSSRSICFIFSSLRFAEAIVGFPAKEWEISVMQLHSSIVWPLQFDTCRFTENFTHC